MYDEMEPQLDVDADYREPQQQPQFRPIAAGSVVALAELRERGWALGEIDAAVKKGVLTHCGGKAAYVTDREIF